MSIKYKLFSITTSLLLALALIIYLFLYFLLPSYYHEYKINTLENSISDLAERSYKYDTDFLKTRLYKMAVEQNLSLLLTKDDGEYVFGQKDMILKQYNKYISERINGQYLVRKNDKEEYTTSAIIYTNDYPSAYKLNILMPLQPIEDASNIIRTLIPYVVLLSIFIALIGAYIYSVVITKPLINIIESEREQENRRKEFVATISHELKTPITIISGQLEGMIYNIGKYKDRDVYLKKSYDATQELKDLVNEMMEVSKREILEQDLSLSKINISELLSKLVKRQAFLIEDKHLNTQLEINNNIEIYADEEKITKAINNIINNAIKYSPEGEDIIIRLYMRNNNKSYRRNNKNILYLEIENTGTRIEERYLSEIFNPFFRIEKSRSRKTGGSGLGLYIVSQILKSHGFKYSMKNKENSVVFTIQMENFK